MIANFFNPIQKLLESFNNLTEVKNFLYNSKFVFHHQNKTS